MSKEYGLIIPNKNKLSALKKPTAAEVFNQDSDSDDSARPTGFTSKIKRHDCIIQQRAVEEDPTVFQYDEIYDDMAQKRIESKLANKDVEKKPKYISKLLVAADRRKRENERRIEREVQREREAEGAEFKDKEAFVTAAYKKKLEEFKEMEEQERREEYLESIGDVTKQGNLDGFYRHLYEQKVNTDKNTIKTESIDVITEEEVHNGSNSDEKNEEADLPLKKKLKHKIDKKSSDQTEPESDIKQTTSPKTLKKKRVYRKHEDESESDEEKTTLTHLPSNLDADSDFSIDSDSDDEPKEKEIKVEPKDDTKVDEIKLEVIEGKIDEAVKDEDKVEAEKIKEKKVKIDIWKKRTVGAVFDDALQRYYERKSLREGINV